MAVELVRADNTEGHNGIAVLRGHANETVALLPLQLVALAVGLDRLVGAPGKDQQVAVVGHQGAADGGMPHDRPAGQQRFFQPGVGKQELVAQRPQEAAILLLHDGGDDQAVQGKQAVVANKQAGLRGNVVHALDHGPEQPLHQLPGDLHIPIAGNVRYREGALNMALQAFALQGLVVLVQCGHAAIQLAKVIARVYHSLPSRRPRPRWCKAPSSR